MPNITGKLGGNGPHGVYGLPTLTGAFKNIVNTYDGVGVGTAKSCLASFELDASHSNPVYGSSTTVRPLSQSTLVLIKY